MLERPLGKITALLSDLGLDVTYAYDDLVFVKEGAFILQFTDDPAQLKLFVNTECDPEAGSQVAADIVRAFDSAGFTVLRSGFFSLSPNADETLNIQFRSEVK